MYLGETSNRSNHPSLLAVCDIKGNLLIYNHETKSQNLIMGKHLGRITCGEWFFDADNMSSILALGSEDGQITLSSEDGDTLTQLDFMETPKDLFFSKNRYIFEDDLSKANVVLSANVSRKIILTLISYPFQQEKHGFIINLTTKNVELDFELESEHGEITSHIECHSGIFLVGFTTGKVVAFVVSIIDTPGAKPLLKATKTWSCQVFSEYLVDFSYCAQSKKMALAGKFYLALCRKITYQMRGALLNNCLKGDSGVVFLNIQDEKSIFQCNDKSHLTECDGIQQVSWSPYDGKTLIITTSSIVLGFIAYIPSLYSTYGSMVAFLTSLREVRCRDVFLEQDLFSFHIPYEPTKLVLGPCHIGTCAENKLLMYQFSAENQINPLRTEINLMKEIKVSAFNVMILLYVEK